MRGEKTTTVYLLTQLAEGFEAIEDKEIPANAFRYGGKCSFDGGIRHFLPIGSVSNF